MTADHPTMPDPESAFASYADLVETCDDDDGALPMLVVCTADGKLSLVGMALDVSPRLVLPDIMARIKDEDGPIDWAIFSSEAWTQQLQDRIPNLGLSMQELKQAGDTSITETVIIIGVNQQHYWSANRHFFRSPDGVTWTTELAVFSDTDQTPSTYAGGPLGDVLITAVRGTTS